MDEAFGKLRSSFRRLSVRGSLRNKFRKQNKNERPQRRPADVNVIPEDKLFQLPEDNTVGELNKLHYAFSWIKGRRPHMEDAHSVDSKLNDKITIFGVYDGHSTHKVSETVAKMLPSMIEQETKSRMQKMSIDDICMKNVLKSSFKNMDKYLFKTLQGEERFGGTTAVLAVFFQDRVFIAHIGDSRAFVFDHKGRMSYISRDHKATDEEEIDRIKNVGGSVWAGRVTSSDHVYGGLAITRAFGDFQYKHQCNSPDSVSVEPEVKSMRVKKISRIFLVCDGVTDVITNNDIKLYWNQCEYDSLTKVSETLTIESYNKQSFDNISTGIIQLCHN